MTTEQGLEMISNKLSLLAALQFAQQDNPATNAERIELLNNFNLPNSEIAIILGMSKHSVEVAQGRLKNKGGR